MPGVDGTLLPLFNCILLILEGVCVVPEGTRCRCYVACSIRLLRSVAVAVAFGCVLPWFVRSTRTRLIAFRLRACPLPCCRLDEVLPLPFLFAFTDCLRVLVIIRFAFAIVGCLPLVRSLIVMVLVLDCWLYVSLRLRWTCVLRCPLWFTFTSGFTFVVFPLRCLPLCLAGLPIAVATGSSILFRLHLCWLFCTARSSLRVALWLPCRLRCVAVTGFDLDLLRVFGWIAIACAVCGRLLFIACFMRSAIDDVAIRRFIAVVRVAVL